MARPLLVRSNRFQLFKGGSSSGGSGAGGGGGEAQPAAQGQEPVQASNGPSPPAGATITKSGGIETYEYNINGQNVRVNFEPADNEVYIDFRVNGRFDAADNTDTRTGAAILMKVRSSVEHFAASNPQIDTATAIAHRGDRLGDRRSELYQRAGFRPDAAGLFLIADIRNGRIVRNRREE